MAKESYKKDANNNPVLVIFIAIIFLLGGGAGAYFGFTSGETMVLGIGAVLFVCGALFLVFGIYRAKVLKAYKELVLNPSAHVTTAIFNKSKKTGGTTKTVNGVVKEASAFFTVYYTYTDETGTLQNAKSVITYTRNQVEHLKSLPSLRVKCKGKLSAILDEVPAPDDKFNL